MASPSTETDYPLENDWEYLHGRINPGVEENFDLVESIPRPQVEALRHRNNLMELTDERKLATTVTMSEAHTDVHLGMFGKRRGVSLARAH